MEGGCWIRKLRALGLAALPSVPSGWPGGRDSVDFGPGTASPKGNAGPPLLSTASLLTPPWLLILNLEGVAGHDSGGHSPPPPPPRALLDLGNGKAYVS